MKYKVNSVRVEYESSKPEKPSCLVDFVAVCANGPSSRFTLSGVALGDMVNYIPKNGKNQFVEVDFKILTS